MSAVTQSNIRPLNLSISRFRKFPFLNLKAYQYATRCHSRDAFVDPLANFKKPLKGNS